MADYQKKKVSKLQHKKAAKGAPVRSKPYIAPFSEHSFENFDPLDHIETIEMRDSRSVRAEKKKEKHLGKRPPQKRTLRPNSTPRGGRPRPSEDLKVIRGGKTAKKIKRVITLLVVGLLVSAIIILHFSAPTGIVEYLQNSYAALGSGPGFPIAPSGGKLENIYSSGNSLLILSDTLVEAYNENGREIYSRQHGFGNPVLVPQKTRTLVYDRGGTGVKLYNMHTVLFDKKLENSILAAAIARNGTCAFATRSRGYAAQVEVVNRNFSSIFKWYSPEELINAVALSGDGKYLAVSAVNASAGEYLSHLYIFNIRNPKPQPDVALAFENTLILSLEVTAGRLSAVSENSITSVEWSGGGRVDHPLDGTLQLFKTGEQGKSVLVTGRSDSRDHMQLAVLSPAAAELGKFEVSGTVRDAVISGDTVFCLTEHHLTAYSIDGAQKTVFDCGYDVFGLAGFQNETALSVKPGEVNRYSTEPPPLE